MWHSVIDDRQASYEKYVQAYLEDKAALGRLTLHLARLRGSTVFFTGRTPHDPVQLADLLPGCSCLLFEEGDEWAEPPDIVVIGMYEYDESFLEEVVVRTAPDVPAFLPQEGLMALLMFGEDWWTSPTAGLDDACSYHHGLAYVRLLASVRPAWRWPSTWGSASNGGRGLEEVAMADESALKKSGYSITDGGRRRPRKERWKILSRVSVPELGLQVVAETIASHVRIRKRQPGGAEKYHRAIQAWEKDLAKLKRIYYDPAGADAAP